MADLRIVFMGTPELACASLSALSKAPGIQLVGVVTQPDRPKGRDLRLAPPPVKVMAEALRLPVLQPQRAREESFLTDLQRMAPDLIAVAAFGQILPRPILELPRFGCLNVHTSLLPRYRGAAPIQWSILNGDAETGVTIMQMDAGLDTGAILSREKTPIASTDNAETLHDRLAGMGAALLVRTIGEWVAGRISPVPQPLDGVSHAPKIKRQDGQLSWPQPAIALWNRVRGLAPWPGAFTFVPAQPRPRLLKVLEAEPTDLQGVPGTVLHAGKSGIAVGCGAGSLRLLSVQMEGGRRLAVAEFLAGHALKPGDALG